MIIGGIILQIDSQSAAQIPFARPSHHPPWGFLLHYAQTGRSANMEAPVRLTTGAMAIDAAWIAPLALGGIS